MTTGSSIQVVCVCVTQLLPGHLLVRLLRHREYVGVHVPHVLPTVRVDHLLAVDGQLLIGVDGHQHNPWGQIMDQYLSSQLKILSIKSIS